MSLKSDTFVSIAQSINNPYIKKWKNAGKQILGYYCTYVPEELFYAANLLPFRIRATGCEETGLGDIYMVRFTCSFVRMTLNLALKGNYDFLDGLYVSNCCDHARRMYELFDLKVFSREEFEKKPPRFYTSIPHIITEEGFSYYKRQVFKLKQDLEEKYKLDEISDSHLRNAIQIYNENRKLLRQIFALRRLPNPKLSGSEALLISLANSSAPKDIANRELKRVLDLLSQREGIKSQKKRIMLIGSVVDNTSFTNLIEEAGGEIVTDLLCFGSRNILDDIADNSGLSPLEKIAKRVYYRMSCPRMMDDHERRLNYIKDQLKNANVDGVILQRINNCDLHGCENMNLVHELKEIGIPVFNLDRENFQKDYTRLRTRIEAFIEML
ncbi:MAG: 2-hydroxyacyl-CoA dehydratase subunit D [Promethearchaeia archaeon]